MAKTWNCSPEMRRTQQAMSPVCAVPGGGDRIAEVGETGFAFREVADGAEVDPGVVAGVLLERRAEEIADDGHGQHRADRSVEQQRQLEEKGAAGVAGIAGFGRGRRWCLLSLRSRFTRVRLILLHGVVIVLKLVHAMLTPRHFGLLGMRGIGLARIWRRAGKPARRRCR